MGGRGDTLGQLLAPLTASLFSILALSWIRRRVNAKPGSAPSPCPPSQPACPCQPLLGSGALPGAVSQLSVPFPLPSPSAHPALHPNPKRGDLQRPVPPGWRAGGCRQAPPASLYSVQSPGVWRGRAPSPCPATAPSPALPVRGKGDKGDKGVPPRCSPRLRLRCRGDPGLPPLYTYIYNPRNKPETTRDQRCVLPGGTGQSSRALPRSRRAAPASLARSIATQLLPFPLSPPWPHSIPHLSVLPSCRPGVQEHLCNVALARGRQWSPAAPVPCCRWEMLPQ